MKDIKEDTTATDLMKKKIETMEKQLQIKDELLKKISESKK
jgi:hypothetical protein